MEAEIAKVNVEKLLQADNAPTAAKRAITLMVWGRRQLDRWDQIVDGKIGLPPNFEAEEGTRLWLNKRQSISIREGKMEWSTEEYVKSCMKMKETTTSLPGPAFCHLKAASVHCVAAKINSMLALIMLLFGFAPKAWCQSVAAMIPKKKEDLRPAKLRLIMLLNTIFFNHNNKWVGKEIMKNGEQYGLLAKEQYGSRKKKSAGQHALNKWLFFITFVSKSWQLTSLQTTLNHVMIGSSLWFLT